MKIGFVAFVHSIPMRNRFRGITVIKVAPLGGVRRALQVAEACGLPCVVSSAVETSVGLAAGLALAGALPSLEYACGLATMALLARDVTDESLVPVDGFMPVLPKPPVPNGAFAADEETTALWLSRFERVRATGRRRS